MASERMTNRRRGNRGERRPSLSGAISSPQVSAQLPLGRNMSALVTYDAAVAAGLNQLQQLMAERDLHGIAHCRSVRCTHVTGAALVSIDEVQPVFEI